MNDNERSAGSTRDGVVAMFFISDSLSSQSAYWIMLPCYLLILMYVLKGHTMRSWR